jgi:serine protease Do
MRVGENVYVIGNPLGYLTFTVTEGILSAFDREIHTDSMEDTAINMFQISAPINSGNSGGPVFNDRGEVIGVAAAKNGSASVEGLGFAVPMDDVRELLDEWQATGYRPRAVLGVTVQPVDGTDRASGEHIRGAGIVSVVPGSAADKADLQTYDVISKIDDHDVLDSSDLISYLRRNYSAGDSAELTVYRMNNGIGKYITIEVTFDTGSLEVEEPPEEEFPEYFR